MALLYVAADASELKGIASQLAGLRPLKWPVDYAQEGVLDDRRIVLAANGAGPVLASNAVEIAIRAIAAADLQSSALEAVVSVGLCGGLRDDLREGQVVVAENVVPPEADAVQTSYLAGKIESDQPHVLGDVVSQNRIAGLAEEKAELRGRHPRAIAVEMEALGVAARAKRAGLPFFCIKVISDRADESFKLDFNRYRTADGHIARGKIVIGALAKPSAIPELFRLKHRADLAAGVLGDFLVSCRFSVQSVDAQ